MVSGVAFTRCRGGILGLAAVGWYYFYRRVGILGSTVPVVIMASFLLAIPRMGQLSTKEGSARSRLEHWSYGLELLKANPVFGVGYGRFTENYSHTAHNSFVLIAAEAGFLGAMTWVALFFCAFRDIRFLRHSPRAPPWLDTFLDALTAALLGWLVSGYFLSQTYKPMPYLLMAILVAGMNVLAREGVEVRHPWGARQMLLTFAVTMGAVMFVYISTRVLWML
jgi:O-antigen ligase